MTCPRPAMIIEHVACNNCCTAMYNAILWAAPTLLGDRLPGRNLNVVRLVAGHRRLACHSETTPKSCQIILSSHSASSQEPTLFLLINSFKWSTWRTLDKQQTSNLWWTEVRRHYRFLISAAIVINACSTFVAFLALVSKKGMPISSANACNITGTQCSHTSNDTTANAPASNNSPE